MALKKTEEQTEEVMQSAEHDDEYYEELVPVKLFRDDNRYKDDVFVAVNGKSMLIKRGEKVMIPRKFALVLENSEEQYARATEISHSYAEKEQVINMD